MLKLVGLLLFVVLGPGAAWDTYAESGTVRVRVNGVQFELRTLVLPGDPQSLARRLDGRWGARQWLGEGGARQVLGRQRGPFHETLTLSAGPRPGSSTVVVAVHDLRQSPAAIPSLPLPLSSGARLLNVVQFRDAADSAVAYTIDLPGTASAALERFRNAALARGWRQLAAPAMPAAASRGLWVQRGAREITLVALPARGGTRVVLLEAGDAGATGVSGGLR